MNNFYVNPTIKKYVIEPLQPAAEEDEDDNDNDEEGSCFDDSGEGFYKPDYDEDKKDENRELPGSEE